MPAPLNARHLAMASQVGDQVLRRVGDFIVAEQPPVLAVDPVTGQPLPGAQPGQGLPGQPATGQAPLPGAAPGLPLGGQGISP